MVVTFKALEGRSFEVQNEHVDKIFEDVKAQMTKIFDQYEKCDKDVLIALMSACSIATDLNQWASNTYGVDRIIETVGAKEIVQGIGEH